MKLAIIGAGNIAKAHLTAAKNIPEIDVVGVYDLDPNASQNFDASVPAYLNAEELMDKAEGAIIATPNSSHEMYTRLAIQKHKHVLCEKPMATSIDGAERMTNEAQNSKLCCRVGLNYRFLNVFQNLKNRIASGEFGKILFTDMEFKRSSALTRKKHTWRDSAETMRTSGALGDLGIHLIDLLHYLFSSEINLDNCAVKVVTHVTEKENIKVHVDDYAVASGMLYNGMHFKMLTSKVALPEEVGFSIKIIGSKKEFSYDTNMKNSYLIKSSIYWDKQELAPNFLADPPSEIYGWSQSFVTQLMNWTQNINSGVNTDNATFLDGLKGQRILFGFLSKK